MGTVDNGETVHLVLQWAEPWGHATTDFAVDVYQIVAGTPTLAFTVDDLHLASGLPEEVVGVSASGGSVTFGIAIRRVAGSGSPLLKYIDFTNGAGTVAIEGGANSGSVAPDAASSRGALTVAASPYGTPDSPEDFSSRGPVVRLFDAGGTPLATPETRHKPDLAAPDGVDTSVPGFDATTPFFGTSAATPAAAGIAALILSAKPAMGIDELYAIMTSPDNTLDCVVPGTPADACGAGFLLADRAVSMALDATPPVIAPAASPALPDGANGWYVGPVTVTWSVGDDESPVVAPTGCGSSAPGDGVTQLTCSATSAGGTASLPLTIKRDSTPPSAPRITGIQAKAYTPATVPKATALACSATDDASGVELCSVAGLASGIGRHTLTATATNGAGLTATSTLAYAVVKPAAISGLKLARTLTLAKLATSGVPLTVHVAAASTTLTVRIVLRIPRPSGGARTVVLGNSAKRLPAGTAHLGIRLSAKARRDLRGARRATLAITVTGRSPGAQDQVLKASLKARR